MAVVLFIQLLSREHIMRCLCEQNFCSRDSFFVLINTKKIVKTKKGSKTVT